MVSKWQRKECPGTLRGIFDPPSHSYRMTVNTHILTNNIILTVVIKNSDAVGVTVFILYMFVITAVRPRSTCIVDTAMA